MTIHSDLYLIAYEATNKLFDNVKAFTKAKELLIEQIDEQQFAVKAYAAIAKEGSEGEWIADRGAQAHAAALKALNAKDE